MAATSEPCPWCKPQQEAWRDLLRFPVLLTDEGQTVVEDVTEDMLKEEIFVHITETDLITVLDIPSTSVSAKSDEAPGVVWVGDRGTQCHQWKSERVADAFCQGFQHVDVFTERTTSGMLRSAAAAVALTSMSACQCRRWKDRRRINMPRLTPWPLSIQVSLRSSYSESTVFRLLSFIYPVTTRGWAEEGVTLIHDKKVKRKQPFSRLCNNGKWWCKYLM